MLKIVINNNEMKFYKFEELYSHLLKVQHKLGSQINEVLGDVIKLLESMDYDEDFKKYYRNLFNSLKYSEKNLVNN